MEEKHSHTKTKRGDLGNKNFSKYNKRRGKKYIYTYTVILSTSNILISGNNYKI
jgi:hypothetical protein